MMNDKKTFRLAETSRKHEFMKTDSILEGLQNSEFIKMQKNQFNSQLLKNYNQIRQLMKQRKNLIKARYESLINKNKEKLFQINKARQQDLRNEAKMLNDKSITQLVDQAQYLSKSKNFLMKLSEIKNMSNFEMTQRNNGKNFWDRSKQIDKEKKRRAQSYMNQAKQLTDLNEKERGIFSEIQKFENQIAFHLMKNRNDPDHVKRAQKLNQQIQKRKNILRQLKNQKIKYKNEVKKIIEEILAFNEQGEKIYRSRIKQIDQLFLGTTNLVEYDNLMNTFQKIIASKGIGKMEKTKSELQTGQFYKNYDIFYEQMERLKRMKTTFLEFQKMNQSKRLKMQQWATFKLDQIQILKRLKDFRRLLLDLNQQKQRNQSSINTLNQMSSMLYPKKKDYQTQDVRREDLKRELKRLFLLNEQIEAKQKQFRDFNYRVQQMLHKRNSIQADINILASKGNLAQYKNKMRELEQLNHKISQKNDVRLKEQVNRMDIQLNSSFQMIYDKYQDLIKQVEVQQQQPSLGVILTKLQKRLTLI